MAIARPIRMLGAAAVLLTLFLVFQLRSGYSKPSSKLTHGMTRDPLLDRASPLPTTDPIITNTLQQPENQKENYGELRIMIIPQTARTPRVPMPP